MTRMKTYLSVEVTHEKPLPEKIAETLTYRIGERVHGYLYAQGQECAVVVRKDRPVEVCGAGGVATVTVQCKDGRFTIVPADDTK
jgi:archaeosine-15-forming tRNA-guanine transglycosylase